MVVYIGREACCAEWIQTDVFIQVYRESIRTDCAIEDDEEFPLLSAAYALDISNEAGALG